MSILFAWPENYSVKHTEHEMYLYGSGVYYSFSWYCFWRHIVSLKQPDWTFCTPEYFLKDI